MAKRKNFLMTLVAVLMFVVYGCNILNTQRSKTVESEATDFNFQWKFSKGEQEGAQAVDFDETGFEEIRLPHDWAIAGPFEPRQSGYAGKLPWQGVGWYRKTFILAEKDRGKRVYFDFDGVMAFPKVYINGELAGQWDYGYTSFRVDATDYVKFGQSNLIAVEVDTRNHGTRWYPGAGIYRKVTMTIDEPVHIGHWATFITTPEVKDDSAIVDVTTTIENHLDSDSKVNVAIEIICPFDITIASGNRDIEIQANNSKNARLVFEIGKPILWDVTDPKLYKANVYVRKANKLVDAETQTFGIRTFEFTADDGFHLNGRRVQLYGVCLHHDQGPLGAAFYPRAMKRQLEIMMDMGINAVRTSHNAPAPELLELCDRLGLVVFDEVFDKWDDKSDRKNDDPLIKHGEQHIRSMAMRDRNHPSIICWSIGNEIGNDMSGRGSGKNPENVKYMSDFFRKYDSTRPVGMACCIPETANQPILDALDFTGWNYARRYAIYRERYPDKPILYSESASTLSTRGFYDPVFPRQKTQYARNVSQVSSYDLNAAYWSDIPDVEFQLMEDDSFVAGEFVWTGIDYIGEPTPFTQQAKSSYFGIVDLCGIPKDRFYLYRSYWRPDEKTIHILPHWNWPDRVGQNVPVFVYTNGDSAELFLNGKSLGKQTKLKEVTDNSYYAVTYKYRLRWDEVIYEPGEIKVVAYKDGKEIGKAYMRTAGEPAMIKLTPDRTKLDSSDGMDLCYILVEAYDEDGNLCALANNLINFEVEGPAEISGVGNGNPLSIEPFGADYRGLFYGKAMLILRIKEGQGGKIKVTATSEGLKEAGITVKSSR